MGIIKLSDKYFKIFMYEEKILEAVDKIARQINQDYKNSSVTILSVLNGSFIFTADLVRRLTIPCSISFVKVTSYEGNVSSGRINTIFGLDFPLKDKKVIIIEDVIDSGNTLEKILEIVKKEGPSDIKTCAMFLKPESIAKQIKIDYFGIEIPADFIVGYGLDYYGHGRQFKDLFKLVNNL